MRKYIYLTVVILAAAFCLPVSGAGRDAAKDVLKLSLEEGKVMVLSNNLDIAIQKITPQVEEARIESEKGVFDPGLSLSLTREDSDTPLSSRSSAAAGGRTSTESETYSLDAGITGKTPLGTEYGLEFNDDRTENTFNSFDAEYDSFAGLRMTQPLLKDFGSNVNSFGIHIAKKNREISVTELKRGIIDTVAEFKKAYWDLVFAVEDLKVREESLMLAESLLDINRKKLRAEVISPLEVTQAEAGAAARREDVIIARRTVREKENALKRFITDDIYGMRNIEIRPTDPPAVPAVAFDFETGFREGIMHRPDYLQAKIEIEKKDLSIKYAENRELPNIDLAASYGYNGLGTSFNDSVDSMKDNPEWSLGLMLKHPLGNRTAKSGLRIAELEARQALLDIKKLEQEIMVEIDNSIQALDSNRQRIHAAKISKQLAEEALRAEELKFKEGLSTSHDVLSFQEDLSTARAREISAVIDYNKSLVEFSRAKGTLLEEEGIILDD